MTLLGDGWWRNILVYTNKFFTWRTVTKPDQLQGATTSLLSDGPSGHYLTKSDLSPDLGNTLWSSPKPALHRGLYALTRGLTQHIWNTPIFLPGQISPGQMAHADKWPPGHRLVYLLVKTVQAEKTYSAIKVPWFPTTSWDCLERKLSLVSFCQLKLN